MVVKNVKINTIKDLKEVLNQYSDDLLVNFGTDDLGFEINKISTDGMSVSIMSDDLQEYMEQNSIE